MLPTPFSTVLAIVTFTLALVGAGGRPHAAAASAQSAAAPASAGAQAAPAGQPSEAERTGAPPGPGGLSTPNDNPYPSTYRAPTARPLVIRNATIMTVARGTATGMVLVRDGKIAAVGPAVDIPADAEVVDATGRFVTPGVIDTHTHLGVYAAPGGEALSDGNELTDPTTPEVWAEHSVWPQDPQFPRDLAGGVTTIQVLPGSGNLIGGRGVVLKVVPGRTVQEMKFPGAKYGLKMACGENPKRVYEKRGPSTRMGNVAGYRADWIRAERYRRRWDKWNADRKGEAPERDLALETLAEVLRGNILVQNHCYRADEMAQMIDIAREFGYKVRSFHHAVEACKIADLLAREDISASMWADWGGFKMEAADGIKANAAFVHAAGARAVIHSDDPSGSQRLNQEAAKAMAAGNAAGVRITPDDAIRWFTANAAWTLGLEDRIGTIEVGKNADLVLWSGSPFSVYTRAERVWIDGALRYDRSAPERNWRTDFELGFVPAPGKGR